MNLLSLFVIIPFLMVLFLLFAKGKNQMNFITIAGSSLMLILSVVLTVLFIKERAAGDTAQMLFRTDYVWYESFNIKFSLGVDGISVAMIMLTAIVVFAAFLVSWNIDDHKKEYLIWYSLLAAGAFGFFVSLDLFVMFFFLEISVVPKFLLIGVWGSGKKEKYAMKLALMLMGGAALVLFGFLGIYYISGAHTMNIIDLQQAVIPAHIQTYLFVAIFVGFGVIGAMFPFHTWVPDGHSAAPTPVSMFLSGISMKLGAYGAFRIAITLLPAAAHQLAWIFLITTGFSVVYGAFSAVAQKDLKYINAYASISHCGLLMFAFLIFNQTAMTGAFLQVISHGLITALFFAVIGMVYSRTHTRMLNEMGGLMKIMPFVGVSFMIAGLASLGLPGFSGFVAEMAVFVGAFQHAGTFYRVLTIVTTTSVVITAVYILRAVGKVMFGKVEYPHSDTISLKDATWWEKLAAGTLTVAITGFGVAPLWLTHLIHQSILPTITQLMK